MGHWDSRTYLASARTVARAALRGRIAPDLYDDALLPELHSPAMPLECDANHGVQ
jgi:hypothetical protein